MAETEKVLVVAVLILASILSSAYANCKTHDAQWDPKKPPVVTQPSRTEPAKVKIDWSKVITNARCVDEYYIYVWRKGSPKENALKIKVGNKNAVSHIVEVEACIEHNFIVESFEDDIFRKDIRQSAIATFKSEAVPRLTSKNTKDFKVGYLFDKIKGIHHLSKVSIRFPKSILEHASCVKSIEVKGLMDPMFGSRSGRQSYSDVARGHNYNLRSSNIGGQGGSHGQGGQGVGGQGQYAGGSGVGGQGQYPGGSGVGGSGQYPGSGGQGGSGVGGQGQYPGNSGVGGQGQYPGYPGAGGQGQYPGGSGVGGQGGYGGGRGQYSDERGPNPDGHHDHWYGQYPGYQNNNCNGRDCYNHVHGYGWHGRRHHGGQYGQNGDGQGYGQYGGGQGYGQYQCPQGGRCKRSFWSSSKTSTTTTTTVRPPIAAPPSTTARPPIGTSQPTVTVTPPFLNETIEIIVDSVEPCKPYQFKLKVYSPQNSVLGEIDDLILPPLPEIPDYHPPPLAQLFKVQLSGQQPVITLQPGLGVPATCLPVFFEAVDRHMQRLEDDLQFHLAQEHKAQGSIVYFKRQLSHEGSAQLKLFGCKCNSTSLRVVTNDSSVESKFKTTFGVYHFEGMHQGKPYYRKPSRHTEVRIVPQLHAVEPPQASGYSVTTTTTTTTTTTPRPAAADIHVHYLYYDPSDKAWMIGEELGRGSVIHKTSDKTQAVCPGDPMNAKTWSHTSTFRWKSDPTMKIDCAHDILF